MMVNRACQRCLIRISFCNFSPAANIISRIVSAKGRDSSWRRISCRRTDDGTGASALRAIRHSSSDSKSSSNEDPPDYRNRKWIPPKQPLEWIPPKQPLAGDKGQSHQYTHVQEERELVQIEKELELIDQQDKEEIVTQAEATEVLQSVSSPPVSSVDEDDGAGVDWLKTRRAVLSGQLDATKANQQFAPTRMMKPDDATTAQQQMADIPVIHRTLFTRKEIVACVEALGGYDIQVVLDNPKQPRMGGTKGIMIVTITTFVQMRTIAETLVRHLRRRELQKVGVVGAELGVEGSVDDPNETWMVVDCGSYVVHLQYEKIRNALDLEGLWSGRDGMHRVDMSNDDAVEDYVAQHPVPDDYWDSSAALTGWDDTLKVLQKSRWTRERQQPAGGATKRAKRKRKGSRSRR